MRSQTMPTRNIHHPRARLKALGHDPRLHIIRPAPISTRPLHNLDAAIKTVSAVRHYHLLLDPQKKTRRSFSAKEPRKSMGQRRRLPFICGYLLQGNATKAYVDAGYSPTSAAQNARRMVNNEKVMAEIARRRVGAGIRHEAKLDKLIESLAQSRAIV